jgi:hypothetical protein
MAFSLRRMLSNITYFKKPGEDEEEPESSTSGNTYVHFDDSQSVSFERAEADSTSLQCTNVKNPKTESQKGSLSDTDLLTINTNIPKRGKKKNKKLKLDIKCSQSMSEGIDQTASNVENTPKHVLLDSKSADLFSQHFRGFDFNHSFDIFDGMSDLSDTPLCPEESLDIESLSDTDISLESYDVKDKIKMCRKVEPESEIPDNPILTSVTPESFGDVEVEKNEEERISLLLNYQTKLEKLDCMLKKLLTEFKFNIDVSKVFHCRSVVTKLPLSNFPQIPELDDVTLKDSLNTGLSRSGSWNFIAENEDDEAKLKVRNQLLLMRNDIDDFIQVYLDKGNVGKCKKLMYRNHRSGTFDIHKGKRQKRLHVSIKKKYKHFDYPDIRDAMINLFEPETVISSFNGNDTHILSEYDEGEDAKCVCRCQLHRTSSPQNDSGVTTKDDLSSQSITSSIGNFSLDSSTLTAYSESLDLIVSYNSFQDASLYTTLLQKAAIERITFYVQVHSIQLKCEQSEQEFETKNIITFHCPSCKSVENEENNLLKHILSQSHCEKIHFIYKTAYINKCVSSGKEIMPSTVLNPMTMYRDDNKIVCFGDAMYACSLCFENVIVGESVLMAHCMAAEHVERRDKLYDILD